MRKLLFNLHLYLALVLGLFVVVIGVTGSIIAFEGDIDRITNSNLFTVQPQGQMLPASELLAAANTAANKAAPGQKVSTIRLPQSPDASVTFNIRGGQQFFLNPYTGAVIGSRNGDTWLNSIHQLHIRLLMGQSGKNVVAGVTAILLFLVASGIYLWWPLKRASVDWKGNGRRVAFDLHNAAGIYASAILFIAGITGVVIHYDDELEQWLHKSAGTAKVIRTVPSAPAPPDAHKLDATQALQTALAAMPGTKALSITAPANPKGAFVIALHYPEDLTPGGRSFITIDQYTGKALVSQDSRSVAWGTRTIIYNRAIHTGDIFGYTSKIVMSLTCLLLISQAITGYFLWWKKLRAKQERADAARVNQSVA
jgi:uncharacterized iron-regulated membrane protein